MTMKLVSTVTVGAGGAASIDFTSIPQTGTDILLLLNARTTNAATNDTVDLVINGVTTNQTRRRLEGDGSSASSASASSLGFKVNGDTATSSTFGSVAIYISNYSGSTNKSVSIDLVTENNSTQAFQDIIAGLWLSTAAITSLSVTPSGSTLKQYSTASLYTITKGSGGATVS